MDESCAIKWSYDQCYDAKTIINKIKDLKIKRNKVYSTVKRLKETVKRVIREDLCFKSYNTCKAVSFFNKNKQTLSRDFCDTLYNGDYWCFQQDSAPALKAVICQNYCRRHLPDFISTIEWPPSSPDLNPLDYSILGILEARVNSIRHTSL